MEESQRLMDAELAPFPPERATTNPLNTAAFAVGAAIEVKLLLYARILS